MPSRKRSAAVTITVTPESAESFRQQLAVAREAAARSSALLATACAEAGGSLPALIQAAGAVLDDAARLQGLAVLVQRLG